MNHFRQAAAVVFLAAAATLSAQPSGVHRLSWMQGCWEQILPDRTVEEQWMIPRGGSMLGMSRTVRGQRLLEHEFIVIREDGDGLVYEAHPSGQAGASFRSKTIGTSSVVFENLKHDFPQRIGYEHAAPGRVSAWIEGVQHDRIRRIEFAYGSVSCVGR